MPVAEPRAAAESGQAAHADASVDADGDTCTTETETDSKPVRAPDVWTLIAELAAEPGAETNRRYADIGCVSRSPMIVIMDSLKGTIRDAYRNPIARNLREYLQLEYETRKLPQTGVHKCFTCLPSAMAHPPTQTNHWDCGIYLLLYVERFFTKPIVDLSKPFLLNLHQWWFTTADVEGKRDQLKALINSLATQHLDAERAAGRTRGSKRSSRFAAGTDAASSHCHSGFAAAGSGQLDEVDNAIAFVDSVDNIGNQEIYGNSEYDPDDLTKPSLYLSTLCPTPVVATPTAARHCPKRSLGTQSAASLGSATGAAACPPSTIAPHACAALAFNAVPDVVPSAVPTHSCKQSNAHQVLASPPVCPAAATSASTAAAQVALAPLTPPTVSEAHIVRARSMSDAGLATNCEPSEASASQAAATAQPPAPACISHSGRRASSSSIYPLPAASLVASLKPSCVPADSCGLEQKEPQTLNFGSPHATRFHSCATFEQQQRELGVAAPVPVSVSVSVSASVSLASVQSEASWSPRECDERTSYCPARPSSEQLSLQLQQPVHPHPQQGAMAVAVEVSANGDEISGPLGHVRLDDAGELAPHFHVPSSQHYGMQPPPDLLSASISAQSAVGENDEDVEMSEPLPF